MDSKTQATAFTTAEAARYLGISESYLRSGRMKTRKTNAPQPPYLKIGRTVRYLKADLDKWLESLKERQVG